MAVQTTPPVALEQPPLPPRRRGRRIVRLIGKTLIVMGFLVLAFVAYELWGTGVVTERAQAKAREGISRSGFPVKAIPGQAIGFIRIPRMRLDMAFVEGSDHEALKKGPGHYADTPLPGEPGNVAIAGHRTTYLHPFWDLQKLRPGDLIELQTRLGTFRYAVKWHRVVAPLSGVWVLNATKVPSLTLTTCNPRFSARERLIVRAVQVSGPGTPRGGDS
jgi:sortase A